MLKSQMTLLFHSLLRLVFLAFMDVYSRIMIATSEILNGTATTRKDLYTTYLLEKTLKTFVFTVAVF